MEDLSGLHPKAQQLSPFDNKTHIHSRGVQEHRHANGAFLLWHSSKAPVLIIRQPHKSGGGWLAATALPCLHLVNGSELTPISAGREKLKRHSRSVSCYFPHRLFSPIFIWLFPAILILITCLYRQSPCLFMTHLYASLKTDFIPTR